MKKPYEGVDLEILRFASEDIITASAEDDGSTNSGDSSGDGGSSGDGETGSGTGTAVTGIFHYGGYGSGAEGYSETRTMTQDPSDSSVYIDQNGTHWQQTGGEWWYPY